MEFWRVRAFTLGLTQIGTGSIGYYARRSVQPFTAPAVKPVMNCFAIVR